MIGIVCGGGDYPRLVARACVEKGLKFSLLLLNGFCNSEGWPAAERLSINIGEIEKALYFFRKNKVDKIIFAGHIKRPDFTKLSLDKKATKWLVKLGKTIFSGDDALLRAIADLLQQEGFEVIAGTDLLEDIFLPEGALSLQKPTQSQMKDIQIGIKTASRLGIFDIGQSAIVCDGKILGKENVDGTSFLIEKCAQLRRSTKGGTLVKISKPQQDTRLDLPTIGPDTIEKLHQNGFDGLAVEAGKCIVIDKKSVIDKSNEFGLFVFGFSVRPPVKIFIIAGEASGDYLGGKLMEDIREVCDYDVEFFGVGGQCMEKAGLRKLFSIEELSIIGIAEVIGKIFYVKRLINRTVRTICEYEPNAVVTIDSSGFTHRVDRKLKKAGCSFPIVHYVAPPVWAWRQWRAKSMKKFIDKLLVLLPFEEALFRKHGLETIFVGHPIATDADFNKPTAANLKRFLTKINANEDSKIVTLLPGSRISELKKHLPLLMDFSKLMINKYKDVKFVIPTIGDLEPYINEQIINWKQKPIVVSAKSDKILAYYSSHLAIAASGTVTLELARVNLPTVVIYKTSKLTYLIVKLLIKIRHVCLINIMAQKTVVPELLQNHCTANNIFLHAEKIINADNTRKQKTAFDKVIKNLRTTAKLAALEVLKSINYNPKK
jgi:lipid-A-disaccharide synthase